MATIYKSEQAQFFFIRCNIRLIILLLLSVVSNSGLCQQVDSNFINLLNAPDKYHGREIEIVGYINFEFDGDCISPDSNSRKEICIGNLADSLLVKKYFGKLNGRKVKIKGFYNNSRCGHMRMLKGSINNITKLEEFDN